MLYSSVFVIALFIATLVHSASVIRFSETDDFDGQCNSATAVTSIDTDDIYSDTITYCFYTDALPVGTWYTRFYDSNDNFIFQHLTYTLGGPSGATGEVNFDRTIPIFYFADGFQNDEIFTMKVENSNGDIHESGTIEVTGLGASVNDVVARLTPPTSLSDCLCGAAGTYCDGDTLNVPSLSTTVYYCGAYSSVAQGQQVNIDLLGVQSGRDTSGSLREISGDYSGYYYYLYASLNYFSNDENIKVSGNLYDSSGSIIDSLSITIGYTIDGTVTTSAPDTTATPDTTDATATPASSSIDSFVANVNSPNVFSDYLETANGVVGNEVIVFNEANQSFLYFNCVFDDVKAGQQTEIVVSGVQNGYSGTSGSSSISNDYSGYARSYGAYVNAFDGNTVLTGECYLRSSSGVQIDYKTVSVNIQINEPTTSTTTSTTTTLPASDGYCQEKPGKNKPACYNQQTQSACENYNKCEWISV